MSVADLEKAVNTGGANPKLNIAALEAAVNGPNILLPGRDAAKASNGVGYQDVGLDPTAPMRKDSRVKFADPLDSLREGMKRFDMAKSGKGTIAGYPIVAGQSNKPIHHHSHDEPGVFDIGGRTIMGMGDTLDQAAMKLTKEGYLVAVRHKGESGIESDHLHFADPNLAPKEAARLRKQQARGGRILSPLQKLGIDNSLKIPASVTAKPAQPVHLNIPTQPDVTPPAQYADKPLKIGGPIPTQPEPSDNAKQIAYLLKTGDVQGAAVQSAATGLSVGHPEVQQAMNTHDYGEVNVGPDKLMQGAMQAGGYVGEHGADAEFQAAQSLVRLHQQMQGVKFGPSIKTPAIVKSVGKSVGTVAGEVLPFAVGGTAGWIIKAEVGLQMLMPDQNGQMQIVSQAVGEKARLDETYNAIKKRDWKTVVENAPQLLVDGLMVYHGVKGGVKALEHPTEAAQRQAWGANPEAQAGAFRDQNPPDYIAGMQQTPAAAPESAVTPPVAQEPTPQPLAAPPAPEAPALDLTGSRKVTTKAIQRVIKDAEGATPEEQFKNHFEKNALKDFKETMDEYWDRIRC
jgi:hypothetical protein